MKLLAVSTSAACIAIAYQARSWLQSMLPDRFLDDIDLDQDGNGTLTAVYSSLRIEPRSIRIRNVEYPFSPGPVYYATGSYAQQVGVTEAVQLMRHANWDLEELTATIQNLPPMAQLDDYHQMYTSIEERIDPPHAMDQSDANFGALRRTISGFSMQLVDHALFDATYAHLDFNLTDHQTTALCGTTMDGLLASNALFVSDFSGLSAYNDAARPDKFVVSVQGFFCVNHAQDGALLPLAIYLSDAKLMYSPFDTPNEWMLAKMAFNAMEIGVQQMKHFAETHLIYEPIRVELMRAMSPYHPIYNLMDHHLFGVFGIPILARKGLLDDQTTMDTTFGWGAVGCLQFVLDVIQSPQLSLRHDFHTDIAMRGLHHIPDHKYVTYGILLYEAIQHFVTAYVDAHYADDHDVVMDRELQHWALRSSKLDIVQDFPPSFPTKRQLTTLLVHILFQVAVKHHAMNGAVTWHSIAAPYSIPSLWNEPLPTRKGEDLNLMDYIMPDRVLPDLVHVAATFQRTIPTRLTLLHAYDVQRFQVHAALKPILEQYKQNMTALDEFMAANEAQRSAPYEFLRPSRLPYFGWI